MSRFISIITSCLSIVGMLHGQPIKLHSHNDYQHHVPFWTALSLGFQSIEIDVILKNDSLYVAHEWNEITPKQTIESLYFEPLQKAIEQEYINTNSLQLLIDVKSQAQPTLEKIIEIISRFPTITGDSRITFVISGNRPNYTTYDTYPDHIMFDYQSLDFPADLPLKKVGLVSVNFKEISVWNGKGRLVDRDLQRVESTIEKVHGIGKAFRFWGSPDSKTAWKALHELGVDYINTDMPARASEYARQYEISTYAARSLSQVYHPTFQSDGIAGPIKNVILFIGDGMGLAQLSAGMYANHNELSITQLKNVGLVKTQASDDFTTDSAAGATAIATGQKTKNRYIGMNSEGQPITNITEYLKAFGYLSGVITTDHLTGATPSAFYAHQPERDNVSKIAQDFLKSNLVLGVGAGKADFSELSFKDIEVLDSLEELSATDSERVVYFSSWAGLHPMIKQENDYLSRAVKASLQFFTNRKNPFFLLVEGALIDSGGHANRIGTVIEEVNHFDQAVAEALRYADQDQETLVIVTADHETGGLSLPHAHLEKREVTASFSTHDHTGIMIPLFAYGPYSQSFIGVYENTDIFEKIVSHLLKYNNTEKAIKNGK